MQQLHQAVRQLLKVDDAFLDRAGKIHRGDILVLAAFGGAMLIIKPGFSADAFPAVIGLLGGMGAGAAYTFVRALSKRKEKSARIVFFFSAFSTLTALPFVIADFHPMTFAQFMCLMSFLAFDTFI